MFPTSLSWLSAQLSTTNGPQNKTRAEHGQAETKQNPATGVRLFSASTRTSCFAKQKLFESNTLYLVQ
jgi:hypothetical protein